MPAIDGWHAREVTSRRDLGRGTARAACADTTPEMGEMADHRPLSGEEEGQLGAKTTDGLWWKTFKRLCTAKLRAASLSAARRPRRMKRLKPRFSLVSPKTGSMVYERVA